MTQHERELYDLVWALKAEIGTLKDLLFKHNPELANEYQRAAGAEGPEDIAARKGGISGEAALGNESEGPGTPGARKGYDAPLW